MKLHTKIFVAMALGVLAGFVLSPDVHLPGLGWAEAPARAVLGPLVEPVGRAFIRLLKMLIVPLIAASIVMGVARVGDVRRLGALGARTFAYYLLTTFASVAVGLVAVNLVRPGEGASLPAGVSAPEAARASVTVGSLITGMIPDNPVAAAANGQILPLIVFSLLLGAVLTTLGERGDALVRWFESLDAAMMRLTDWIVRLTPVGVFALIAGVVVSTGPSIFANVGRYMTTVLLGLAVHAFVTLPVVLRLVGRASPRRFVGRMAPALTTAFSTASSSATLPLTMECVERDAGIEPRVASFVLPLGATINMDGTALYESVAAVFIAQLYGIHLGLGQQVIVFLTATLAAIGAAGIPSAGLVTLAIVLGAVGLPLDGIGVILAVDRILDMCRTTVNVWGDAIGCAVVARLGGAPTPGAIR